MSTIWLPTIRTSSRDVGGATKITDKYIYRNSENKNVSFNVSCYSNDKGTQVDSKMSVLRTFCNEMRKYIKNGTSDISYDEVLKLKENVYKATHAPRAYRAGASSGYVTEIDVLTSIDRVLNLYTDEASDGGKNITAKERSLIFEILHKWFGE